MTGAFCEILILAFNLLSADTLALIADVIQKMFNHLDEAAFQNLAGLMHRFLVKSP